MRRGLRGEISRSFSHAKSYRVSFPFTPKLSVVSDKVVVIREDSDFSILIIVEIKYMTQIREKTGICKSVLILVIATVVAIRDDVKSAFDCKFVRFSVTNRFES